MSLSLFDNSLGFNETLSRPSIFVLTAAEGLRGTLKNAFDYALRILCDRYPQKLTTLYKYGDELYLILECLLQKHYLSLHRALFSEEFYGLYRVSTCKPDSVIRNSLIFHVLLPYFKLKCDRNYEQVKDQESTQMLSKRQNLMLKFYPYIHFIFKIISVFQSLAYSLGISNYHSIFTQLATIQLNHLTDEKRNEFEGNLESKLKTLGGVRKFGLVLFQSISQTILVGLEVGSFFLQFLEWWYSREKNEDFEHFGQGPDIPHDKVDWLYQKNSSNKMQNICPICENPLKNATLVQTSGFVFCYICIAKHLREKGQFCPVTNYPTGESKLVRIFDDS